MTSPFVPRRTGSHRYVSSMRVREAVANAAAAATASTAAPSTPAGAGGTTTTPQRPAPQIYQSPTTLRAEEETIVVELGTRQLRIGLAGDCVPRGTVRFGPEQQRRVGDLRVWTDGYASDWRRTGEDGAGTTWDAAYELWQMDLRRRSESETETESASSDTGLVADKLERALRDAYNTYLLVDSRPRRVVVVLAPALPVPLIAAVVDTLFGRFQTPSVSLLSSPVATTAAAGLRNALVVDLGWRETVVTSVYEFREVACTRSVRAGRMLVQAVHDLLAGELSADYKQRTEQLRGLQTQTPADLAATTAAAATVREHLVSFAECEEVTARLVWCRQAEGARPSKDNGRMPEMTEEAILGKKPAAAEKKAELEKPEKLEKPAEKAEPEQDQDQEAGLATVAETDESDSESNYGSAKSRSSTPPPPADDDHHPRDTADDAPPDVNDSGCRTTRIPLRSCAPPTTLTLSFDQLAEPCETTFFGGTGEGRDIPASWDDDELPVPLLLFMHLRALPLDVRALCMSRILFVGGCARVLGLRARLFDELARLTADLGWDGVRGRAVAAYEANPRLKRERKKKAETRKVTVTRPLPSAPLGPPPSPSDTASATVVALGYLNTRETIHPTWNAAATADRDRVEAELQTVQQQRRRRQGNTLEGAAAAAAAEAAEAEAASSSAPPPPSQVSSTAAPPTVGEVQSAELRAGIDPVEVELRRIRKRSDSTSAYMPGVQPMQPLGQTMGELRAVTTLGAFSGASLLTNLRVPGLATVDREQWAAGGVAGAVRPSDVDRQQIQRQSFVGMGARVATGGSWTLGAWGML